MQLCFNLKIIVSLESIVLFSDLSRMKAVSKAKRNDFLTMVLASGKISSYAPVNEKRFFWIDLLRFLNFLILNLFFL